MIICINENPRHKTTITTSIPDLPAESKRDDINEDNLNISDVDTLTIDILKKSNLGNYMSNPMYLNFTFNCISVF